MTLAVAVVVAAAVGATLLKLPLGRDPGVVALSLSVSGDRVALTHRGGGPLDVAALRIRVLVDGTPLVHQPPVPFFAARGFASGPTGPFNRAADPEWGHGETAALRVADTNRPALDPGDHVAVVVSVGDRRVARLTATATPRPADRRRKPPPLSSARSR